MKIGIPCTTAAGSHSRLHIPFNEAPFFAFWDAATERLEFKRNPLAHKASACAYAAGRRVQKQGAEALICAAIGGHAAKRLSEDGLRVLLSEADELDTLGASYRSGALAHSPRAEHAACSRQRHGQHGQHQHRCGCRHPHDHPAQGAGRRHCQAHATSGSHR